LKRKNSQTQKSTNYEEALRYKRDSTGDIANVEDDDKKRTEDKKQSRNMKERAE
jgi:hypothetical protein